MASSIILVIILSVAFHASLALPISVQSLEKSKEIELTQSAIRKLDGAIELVQSLSTVTLVTELPGSEAEHDVKRTKRDITRTSARCPADRIEYGRQCLTPEQLAEYNEDDGPVDYYDYEAER